VVRRDGVKGRDDSTPWVKDTEMEDQDSGPATMGPSSNCAAIPLRRSSRDR